MRKPWVDVALRPLGALIWRILRILLRYRVFVTLDGLISRLCGPRLPSSIVVEGHTMNAASFDRVVALWMWKLSVLEPLERDLLEKLVRPGMTVVDIGANIGIYTLLFARWVGPGGRVLAFEPDPDNFALLQKNIRQNGYGNVTVYPFAVSNRIGTSKLFVSNINRGDNRLRPFRDQDTILEIKITTLDAVTADVSGPVDLVKMDIQGGEYEVLEGMTRTLKRNPQIVFVTEFDPQFLREFGHSGEDFLNLVRQGGLRPYLIDERHRRLEDLSEPELIKRCEGQRDVSLYLASRVSPRLPNL